MSGNSGFSWGSAVGDLSNLVTTAGKDYFNARFNQRNSVAQTPIYTTQSTTNPATQAVPSGSTASGGGSMLTSPLVIGGAVVVVALVAYLAMRK